MFIDILFVFYLLLSVATIDLGVSLSVVLFYSTLAGDLDINQSNIAGKLGFILRFLNEGSGSRSAFQF